MTSSSLDDAIAKGRQRMDKSVEHYERELRGIRTGRATTALIDSVKVDYYGSPTELRELAAISVAEPTQLLVKPFDPSSKSDILKAIEMADLGLNPMADGESIRVTVPPPSAKRRTQLVAQVRRLAEEVRIAIRNERRDANRQVDRLVKESSNDISKDLGHDAKGTIDDLTKTHVKRIDELCDLKAVEVEKI